MVLSLFAYFFSLLLYPHVANISDDLTGTGSKYQTVTPLYEKHGGRVSRLFEYVLMHT